MFLHRTNTVQNITEIYDGNNLKITQSHVDFIFLYHDYFWRQRNLNGSEVIRQFYFPPMFLHRTDTVQNITEIYGGNNLKITQLHIHFIFLYHDRF